MSISIEIDQQALRKLERDLNGIEASLNESLREWLQDLAGEHKLQIWLTGSYDTGEFYNSVQAREFLVESETPQSFFLETGTRKIEKREPLRKALENKINRLDDLFDEWFDKQFEGSK